MRPRIRHRDSLGDRNVIDATNPLGHNVDTITG